jgi:hypothetical protein
LICLIALVAFAILGLFSVKYRTYFFEALDCVTKKVTLRKCTTSFDQKMKMKVSSKVAIVNKSLGSFTFKHFETISWVVTILMIASLIWTAYVGVMGAYNYYAYGNCNGPNSTEACVYNAVLGKDIPTSTATNGAIITSDNNTLNCDNNYLLNAVISAKDTN